jgi:PEP-CTERM motif
VLLIGFMPLIAWAGAINGTVTGSKVSVTGTYDATGPETVTVTTIDIDFFTSCYFITNGVTAGGFGAYNFVFAGEGVASGIASIDPSDFTISQYSPWVVNNNATTNNITGPDSANYNRGLTNEDAGGANIVISYKPQNAGDPTSVNFVQAYILNTNGAGFTTGTIDNGGSGGPFYNENGVSGTGTTNQSGTIPLVTNATTSAWLVDIPYTPEKGYSPPYADDTINSETDTFQTFISAEKVIGGTTYNVLYGGVQWGYTFTTVDIPEPATLTLSVIGATLLFAGCWRRRRTAKG